MEKTRDYVSKNRTTKLNRKGVKTPVVTADRLE